MLYYQDLPEDSPTKKTIKYHINALKPFWGAKSLGDVKGSTCREYIKGRTECSKTTMTHSTRGPVKSSTARQELKTFQAAINHWHEESPLKAVPKVKLPPAGERRERVLERSEVAAMLWACRNLSRTPTHSPRGAQVFRDYGYVARFILIGIYTGTRHDAILDLKWNASPTGGHIDLERGIMFRRGTHEKETSKRRPPVQLPRRLHRFFRLWKRHGDQDVQHVIHYNGTRILKMKRAWAHVVKTAGLGPDVTPHVLRHTCCSWHLWDGMPTWKVGGIVGADAATIDRVYGHHKLGTARGFKNPKAA
jgi:integrase